MVGEECQAALLRCCGIRSLLQAPDLASEELKLIKLLILSQIIW